MLNTLIYPADLAARSVSILIFVWVFINLWSVTYRAMGQDQIGGMSLRETIWYLMLAEAIVLSKPRLAQNISAAVKDGSIAYLLNKPYNFLLYQISIGIGESITRLPFNLIAGGALVWMAMGPPPDLGAFPLVLIAIALGWIIDFLIAALIGLTAFMTEEIAAFEWIYAKFLLLLGGLLIPLDFFPAWLKQIAQALPFAYTIYGPARLFVHPSVEYFIALSVGQLFWLISLGIGVALWYRKGTAWLTINGG
ncbi:MAG: ABC-2 family transporter protein [Chloroflexi bacterium]|nr:ABC-2 family transporter protein [Chloroflexota bacterium]